MTFFYFKAAILKAGFLENVGAREPVKNWNGLSKEQRNLFSFDLQELLQYRHHSY
jgi:hypothetical protein